MGNVMVDAAPVKYHTAAVLSSVTAPVPVCFDNVVANAPLTSNCELGVVVFKPTFPLPSMRIRSLVLCEPPPAMNAMYLLAIVHISRFSVAVYK